MQAVTTWRSEASVDLILLRHAEAQKNLEDRHGGGNPRLTDLGIRHCGFIYDELFGRQGLDLDKTLVLAQPVEQVRETVETVGLQNCVQHAEDEALRGIALGELSGLSRTEAAMRYPGAAALLEQWRGGRLKLPDLTLPGGEAAHDFHSRVTSALATALSDAQSGVRHVVLVSTRSTLIMLQNSLMMDADFHFDRYRPWEFSNGSLTRWKLSPESPPQLNYFNLVVPIRGDIE